MSTVRDLLGYLRIYRRYIGRARRVCCTSSWKKRRRTHPASLRADAGETKQKEKMNRIYEELLQKVTLQSRPDIR
jgi:hypothetical protein